MLSHVAGFDSLPAALGAAVCAHKFGDSADHDSRTNNETPTHLDISKSLQASISAVRRFSSESPRDIRSHTVRRLSGLELFSIDDYPSSRSCRARASEKSNGISVLGGHGVNFYFVSGLERIFSPADLQHGYRILSFDDPMSGIAFVVLDVHFHENVRIRPNIVRHGSLDDDRLVRVIGRSAMMSMQWRGNHCQASNYEANSPETTHHCILPMLVPDSIRFCRCSRAERLHFNRLNAHLIHPKPFRVNRIVSVTGVIRREPRSMTDHTVARRLNGIAHGSIAGE